MNGFNYYRIKMIWEGEGDNGEICKIKSEELAYVTSYTEAEKVAYALIAEEGRDKISEPTFEIIKTKIEELLYSDVLQSSSQLTEGLVNCFFEETDDTGVGLYGVKVMHILADERTGKEKRSHSTIYVPARSNVDANSIVTNYLKTSATRGDFVVRDAKFDPTASILWPKDYYKQLTDSVA